MYIVIFSKKYVSSWNYSKILYWFKIFSITGGTQILIQLFGFISGILIIRLMPIREYAWYTISNTMLGTLTLLSDGGISTGVMAEGGKVWQDKNKLGEVLSTGMQLRNKFAVWSLIFTIPILVYLLVHQQASFLFAILISLSLIPAFVAALSDNLLEIPLKLHQVIIPLQKNQLFASVFRLVMIIATLFFLPYTYLILLANGIPRLVANFRLKQYNLGYVNFTQNSNELVKKNILKIVSRLLPGVIYYCFSGQITIWILSLFGNNSDISQLGGLARLSMILSLIGILLKLLIVPRFVKMNPNSKEIRAFFVQAQLLLILFFLIMLLVLWIFSKPILWILGNSYSHLQIPFIISMAVSAINILATFSFDMHISKGWTMNPFLSIGLNIGSLIVGIIIFKPNLLISSLHFGLFTACFQYLMYTTFCLYKVFKPDVSILSQD